MWRRLKAAWEAFKYPPSYPMETVDVPRSIPQFAVILPLLHCGHRDSRWAIDPKTFDTVCLNCYMHLDKFLNKKSKYAPKVK